LGSLRAELYRIFYIPVFSYFFLSKNARTLKYAWAVPVGICYNIKYLHFTTHCFRQSNVPIVSFNFAEPVFLTLFVLTCLLSSVCAVLSALCYLLCPVCPVFPVLLVLLTLSCSCLSCLYCSALDLSFYHYYPFCPVLDILYRLLYIPGFSEAAIPSCLPCPSLHSFLSSPVFFKFYHSVQYCYICFLDALYFLTFPVYPLLSVPTLLSCPITPVCDSCLYFA
jgi:hypothetical protein